jgi:apolipoprotein D and lipocalin family protein
MLTTTLGCTSIPDNLEPVTEFDADRYLGTWYEIARLDHSFERNLSNVSATYTRGNDGTILVINKGYNAKAGEWKQAEGRASFLKDETIGSLKVSFFGPFYGGYHIIELDRQGYQYSMVTGPNRSYLWILARSKTLDEDIYRELIQKAGKWGFDTNDIIRVEHDLRADGGRYMNQQIKTNNKMENELFAPCPNTPNCVSSIDTSRGHFIQPLEFTGSARDAQYRLLRVLNGLKEARVVTFEENLIEAEFVSSVFRFVDDVKFYVDDRKKIIHVKSASRVGFSDLGVNRRRVEKIRKQLEQSDELS